MLMTVTFLLLVVLLGGFIVLRIKRQNRQATPRRHQREPRLNPDILNSEPANSDSNSNSNSDLDSDDALGLSEPKPAPKKPVLTQTRGVLEYLALHVMAPSEYVYSGYELLQALLANGLRYGEKNIFHRHETKTGRGSILFSLAAVNKPGTFELPKMGNFSCPGLVLFMLLKNLRDPMAAFDIMLETAKQLAEDLGGEVWDETRKPLNMDTIAQIRARIRHFEENQRTPDFFPEIRA